VVVTFPKSLNIKITEQVAVGVVQHPTKFQIKIFRKKVWYFLSNKLLKYLQIANVLVEFLCSFQDGISKTAVFKGKV